MSNQFENPKTEKMKEDTPTKTTPEQGIENAADKAAEKASNTEERYDQGRTIFSN
jgi:hypothetical protein